MVTIAEQRREAEERSEALLRAIVPPEELHWGPHPEEGGRGWIEVTSQKGNRYRIIFSGTVENICALDRNGDCMRHICGGPWLHADYAHDPDHRFFGMPEVDVQKWCAAMEEARAEGNGPLTLPIWDFYLGQYLALKYDEEAFLEKAYW